MKNRSQSYGQINEEEIARYLSQNPDFFERHSHTLHDLRLQHPSGRAVSLIEKQVSALRERNTELRHKLNQLLENARENDRLFERSKRLVLSLMECADLGDAVDVLYYSFDKEFNIPFTRLILFSEPLQPSNTHTVSLDDAKIHLGRHLTASRATSGGLSRKEMDFLFGKDSETIGSAAMAPLYYNQWLGVLAVGHPDIRHYQLGMGTIFLTHIAEVLDRLLPYYLNIKER